jgi:hypothetical protein
MYNQSACPFCNLNNSRVIQINDHAVANHDIINMRN